MRVSKFPMRVEVNVSEQMAAALERVASANETTVSAVLRHAMQLYLAHLGALNQPAPRQANSNGREAVV